MRQTPLHRREGALTKFPSSPSSADPVLDHGNVSHTYPLNSLFSGDLYYLFYFVYHFVEHHIHHTYNDFYHTGPNTYYHFYPNDLDLAGSRNRSRQRNRRPN
jgi:hypothetical protein